MIKRRRVPTPKLNEKGKNYYLKFTTVEKNPAGKANYIWGVLPAYSGRVSRPSLLFLFWFKSPYASKFVQKTFRFNIYIVYIRRSMLHRGDNPLIIVIQIMTKIS